MARAMRELELWHGPRVEDNNKYDIQCNVVATLMTPRQLLTFTVIAVL